MAEVVDFDTFYLATRHDLLAQLTLMTADGEQAEHVVQEAFVRAWARWDRVGRMDDPLAWVRMASWRLAAAGPWTGRASSWPT